MMRSHFRGFVAALLAATTLAACSSSTGGTARTSPQPTAAGGATPPAAARAPVDSARQPYTPADVHFMTAMIGHHAQAIVMAAWAETHDASPSIRALAARIVNGQQDEIMIMQQWLRDRGQPVPQPHPSGMRMIVNGVEHAHVMPGMLSDDQMKQLDKARGKEFDRLFLQFMIQHHRGAVTMVKDLFGTYGAGQDDTVFKLASDVNVDQTTEIDRMQQMLVAILFEPRTP